MHQTEFVIKLMNNKGQAMTKPDEFYGVNVLPPLSWALDLYFRKKGPVKKGIVEVILPAGKHKERMMTKGEHQIVVWLSDKHLYARAKCQYDNDCEFNSDRVDAADREALKSIDWEGINDRRFFKGITKLLMRLNLDFVLLIRALYTICNKRVEIPLTTQYGRTFKEFDEYRKNRWPEDARPDDRERFLEEVLVRVCFWIQTAHVVGALK